MAATLYRYLVMIRWQSGSLLAYCSQAPNERDAIKLVTSGRESDVLGADAFLWDPSLGGPRVKLTSARAFRLKDQPTIEAALTALRVTTDAMPRTTVAAPSGGSITRPGGPGPAPWRPKLLSESNPKGRRYAR